MKNKIYSVFVILIILNMVTFAVFAENQNLQKKVKLQTINVKDVSRIHRIPAIVLATNRANLSFQLSGAVSQVFVKIGQKVEAEQVLMSLYNPNLEPSVQANLANLDAVNAQIQQAIRDLANLKVLRRNNSASRTAYEHKETELKNFQAKRRAIEAQIDLSKANQQESLLKAPFAGTVVTINKEVGEFIAVGLVAVVINQVEKQEVEVNIPAELSQNLALGMTLSGSFQGNVIEFKIAEMTQVANPISHLHKLVLQIQNNLNTAIGQEVLIDFPQIYASVYQLPLETVIDDGINQPYIFVSEQGIAKKISIKPLFIANNQIVFRTAEKLELPVVIKGQSQISAGMRLQKIP